MEISPAPRLAGWHLRELRSPFFERLVQCLHVCYFDGDEDQRGLSIHKFLEIRLVDASKVQAHFVARDSAVERWRAVQEIDFESQCFLAPRRNN